MRNLDEYAIQCMEELDAIGIEYGNIIEVKVNTRAKKRWGQCRAVPGGYSINISVVLLDERNDEQGLKETIIHELLHSCKGCRIMVRIGNDLLQKSIEHMDIMSRDVLLPKIKVYRKKQDQLAYAHRTTLSSVTNADIHTQE